MSVANDIRRYCLKKYIVPARVRGDSTILICAGDVHRAMNYTSRHPAVCDAINTKLFQKMANINFISRSGPKHGSSTTFTFKIIQD